MVPYGDDFARIRIPVLSITGYYDDGQISALQYFREHTRHLPDADHRLLIGPYDHFGTQANVKAMELRGFSVDPIAQFDTDAITFQWFDHVLNGAPLQPLLADRVNYQLMGANRWEHAPSLQAAGGGRWHDNLPPFQRARGHGIPVDRDHHAASRRVDPDRGLRRPHPQSP